MRSPEDRQLAEELVERARRDGVELVGPGGLLPELTKNVLEAGLEAEMSEHSATTSTTRPGATPGTHGTGPGPRRCSPMWDRSISRYPVTGTGPSNRSWSANASAG